MRNQLLGFFVFGFLLLVSCKDATNTETAETPDYATFNKKVEVIRSFFKAHAEKDTTALSALLSDTLKFSPPYYNGNKWLGKDELMAALKNYQENYDNIKYVEGLNRPDTTAAGYYSGNVYPQGTATVAPVNIRTYGTWTGTHKGSGQEVGIKYFALITINDDGKIVGFSDYFDTNSLMPKNPK